MSTVSETIGVKFHTTTEYDPKDVCGICFKPFGENNPNVVNHVEGPTHLMHRKCCFIALSADQRCGYCRREATFPDPVNEKERKIVEQSISTYGIAQRRFGEASGVAAVFLLSTLVITVVPPLMFSAEDLAIHMGYNMIKNTTIMLSSYAVVIIGIEFFTGRDFPLPFDLPG